MFSGINATGYISRGSADPSSGSGKTATLGSLYLRATGGAGTLYQKTGTGDTDWTQVVPASFTGDLDVTGAITASTTITATGNVSGARFLAGDGTNTEPSFAFTSDGNTGAYREAADTFSIATNGARIIRARQASIDIVNTFLTIAQYFTLTGVQSTQLSTTTNDLALTAVGALRLTTSGGAQILTSITNGTEGRPLWIENNNAVGGDNITLQDDDGATGTAANRFSLSGGTDLVLAPQSGVWAKYNDGVDRWVVAQP